MISTHYMKHIISLIVFTIQPSILFSQDHIFTNVGIWRTIYFNSSSDNIIVETISGKLAKYDFLITINQKEEKYSIIAKNEFSVLIQTKNKYVYRNIQLGIKKKLKKRRITTRIDANRNKIFINWAFVLCVKKNMVDKIDYKKIDHAYELYKSGKLKLSEDMDIDIFLE